MQSFSIGWAKQLQACFNRGYDAAKRGEPVTTCPYKQGQRGGTGIASPGGNLQEQRRRYWCEGHRQYYEQQNEK